MIYQDSYSKNIEKLNKTSKETYAYFQEEKQKLEAIEKNIKSNESLITKALSTQKRSPSESVNISSLKHKKNQLYKEYEEKCILLRELQKLYERLSKVDPITEVFNLAGLTLTSTKECEQSPSSGKFFATFIKEMKPKETAEYSFIFLDKSTQKVCSHATAFYIGEDKHIRFFDTNRGEYRVPHEQFEKFIGGYIEKHYATPSKHIIRFVANKMPAAITTHPPTKLATPMTANAQKTPKEVKVTH
ncbi:MAG: hypothetical protein IT497_02690 [Ottowia sp.]|nr:hypothetical protein [Ottowia sp.]